ncbi:HEPN domain-containing protein [Megalodesulfovibrio gigas]|uniref:Putative sugar transporter n=1 Tax=Megalodesulfovibrio gigas (strain ATCC 19364 / DSM 1382 / NCIMB 9332 / VKM B-1759) TaxID=1121448 RepID=T2GDW9_MEGG1|nr:hypothetical protein [Megalodesulfovibrio gigas]AGW14321.1 putative sugar transporter [Megalodesulfovibrio gigas DSM 1382 = ATCC 19364]
MMQDSHAPQSLPAVELSLGRMYFEDARLLAHARRWEACLQLLAVACRHACRAVLASHGMPKAEYVGLQDRVLPGQIAMCDVANALAENVAAVLNHARYAGYPDQPPLDRDVVKTRFFTTQEILDYVQGCLG